MGIKPIMAGRNFKEIDMGRNNLEYIGKLARTIIGQLKIVTNHPSGPDLDPQELWEKYGSRIQDHIRHWSSETLGKIAACGGEYCSITADEDRTSLYEVHFSSWLETEKVEYGGALLNKIAATAIVAAIADIGRFANKESRFTVVTPELHRLDEAVRRGNIAIGAGGRKVRR